MTADRSRPMRVLHTNMLRGWGGQSNRILTEARGTRAAGHAVAIAAPTDSQLLDRAEAEGIEVWRGFRFKPPVQVWRFLPDLLLLRRRRREWRPDIIHLHGSQDTWLVVIDKFLSRRGTYPVVIRSKHNIFPWRPNAANRWLYPRIDGFITSAKFIEEEQVARFPGLEGKPRAAIVSAPDLGRFGERKPSPLQDLVPAIREGRFVWGITARLRPEKAIDVLLDAFATVHRERPEAFLVIAGGGSDREALEARAHGLGLDGQAVAFLGHRDDIPEILSGFDAYVLPSRAEGIATSVLEALVMGLPTVAARTGGIPESVIHEQTGLLVDAEDAVGLAKAMIRMMDDPELRARLSANARRLVRERFSVDALVRATLDFYSRLLPASRL